MTMRRIVLVSLCLTSVATAQPGMTENTPGDPPPELVPEAAPQPSAPMPGSTQATFLSTSSRQWDVLVDQSPACQTPCSIWVPPTRFITFRSLGDQAPVLLEVGYLPSSPTIVHGKPYEGGKYAAGVTFTTLSGIGLVTGITLLAVGYGSGSDGMRTAGLITGIPSALGLYLSIRLMQSAVPKARIGPAQPYVAGNTVGLAGSF
jgi:hypothetical protein